MELGIAWRRLAAAAPNRLNRISRVGQNPLNRRQVSTRLLAQMKCARGTMCCGFREYKQAETGTALQTSSLTEP